MRLHFVRKAARRNTRSVSGGEPETIHTQKTLFEDEDEGSGPRAIPVRASGPNTAPLVMGEAMTIRSAVRACLERNDVIYR